MSSKIIKKTTMKTTEDLREEFLSKWIVAFEDKEQEQEFRNEMNDDLQKIIESLEQKVCEGELYWKKRCELAEKCLGESPCDPDITGEQIKAHNEYNEFIKNSSILVESEPKLIESSNPKDAVEYSIIGFIPNNNSVPSNLKESSKSIGDIILPYIQYDKEFDYLKLNDAIKCIEEYARLNQSEIKEPSKGAEEMLTIKFYHLVSDWDNEETIENINKRIELRNKTRNDGK